MQILSVELSDLIMFFPILMISGHAYTIHIKKSKQRRLRKVTFTKFALGFNPSQFNGKSQLQPGSTGLLSIMMYADWTAVFFLTSCLQMGIDGL